MVFLIIQTYLGYKTRTLQFIGFDPKLVEKGKFFRLFSLFSAFSICTESTFKVKIAERKKIVHQVYDPPFNFLEILLFNFIRRC